MHLLVQSIKRGGYFCIALPPTGWSPPLGKVSWNLPYGQCLLQHSEEFITVDYQSFLMHTKLIAVHFFLLPTALGCSLIHESGFTALSSRAGKGDSFGAGFNPVYLLTVLTGTISTQQADSFPAIGLGLFGVPLHLSPAVDTWEEDREEYGEGGTVHNPTYSRLQAIESLWPSGCPP